MVLNNPERGFHFENYSNPIDRSGLPFIEGTTIFLCESEGCKSFLSHFFHLLEHIVGLWSFYGDQHFEDVKLIVMASTGKYDTSNWEGPNSINRHLLKALFPNAAVKTWSAFLQEHKSQFLCMQRVIFSDRALTLSFHECNKIGKMLGAALPYLNKAALNNLATKVNSYAETPSRNSQQLSVTYITRPMPRALEKGLRRKFAKRNSKRPRGQFES